MTMFKHEVRRDGELFVASPQPVKKCTCTPQEHIIVKYSKYGILYSESIHYLLGS
jgi:hypothetical protein